MSVPRIFVRTLSSRRKVLPDWREFFPLFQADGAIDCFDGVRQYNRHLARARLQRGIARCRRGDVEGARLDLDAAVRLDDRVAAAFAARGAFLFEQSSFAAALSDLEQATRLDPQCAVALARLAWLLATCPLDEFRDGRRAVALAERAVELTGGENIECCSSLAAALAEAGEFEEAIRRQTELIERIDDQAEKARQRALLESYYRRGQPLRGQLVSVG
jgi:tetratricopeptide (TPR) repeat protein